MPRTSSFTKYRGPPSTTFERDRPLRANGKKYAHPIDEAGERLLKQVVPVFKEFLVFRFEAVNEPPYGFAWTNEGAIQLDYAAALVRLSHQ